MSFWLTLFVGLSFGAAVSSLLWILFEKTWLNINLIVMLFGTTLFVDGLSVL